MLVDSHCHLNHFEDVATVITEARAAGVTHMLNVCVNLEEFAKVLEIANKHNHVYASVGVQPSELVSKEPEVAEIVSFADDPSVIAVGEAGLDYHYDYVARETQQQRFYAQICAAKELRKPLIVHMRQASEDVFSLLRSTGADEVGGVMHCFTESWEVAKKAIELNFYISFSGIVTFRAADSLREVVKKVPLNRLLIETDAPYLAPVPMRGKTNKPAFVRYVAECVAVAKSCSVAEIADHTAENFFQLFNIG